MSKPDWKDAPEWASYLAMDENGEWCWYENKPSNHLSEYWKAGSGRVEVCFSPYDVWADSLEVRPE